jgi:uncharacterized membrane protein
MESQTGVSAEQPSFVNCYIWGILFPVYYLLSVRRKQQHPRIRFHCIQSLLLYTLLLASMYWSDEHASTIASFIFLVSFVEWMVALVQSMRRKTFKLPFLGTIAEHLASITQNQSQ